MASKVRKRINLICRINRVAKWCTYNQNSWAKGKRGRKDMNRFQKMLGT